MLKNKSDRGELTIQFAGYPFILSSLNALYWPAEEMLVVADLHLEKGSYFARRGNLLPVYDSLDSLNRIAKLCKKYHPKKLLSLGDNIHDKNAFQRMAEANLDLLLKIANSLEKWIWIRGNHDFQPSLQLNEKFEFCDNYQIDNICFTHNILKDKPFQILGHYHPKLSIRGMSGKCFLQNEKRIILPAFGTYTGGLDIQSAQFKQLNLDTDFHVFMVYKEKIWQLN